jgi:branched-chain amino acid transport system substrate-binding protein
MKLLALAAVGSLALVACGNDGGDTEDETSSEGGGTVVIGTDLPLQGANQDASADTNNMIRLYLESIGNKVTAADGTEYTVEIKEYDNSTAAKGGWDDATCTKNAQDHVLNDGEIAVMGTYNSGCAKLQVPTLNQDPDGPMLMVSHANTAVGLTKPWDPGEPDKYFPTGKRSYARVVATDDFQGAAIATFAAEELGVTRCFVINDNQTYGQGVAKSFVDSAAGVGIEVLGNEPWDFKQPNYTALFESIKAEDPDCLIMSGIYDQNGGQLVKDKVAILGDNEAVKTIAPDGFVGFPDLLAQPEAEGMFTTFAGLSLDQIAEAGGNAGQLMEAFQAEYGKAPSTGYALYGVAAVQVILEALKASDGTRAGVNSAVFTEPGVSVSADVSGIGKEFTISTETGDISTKDITVQQIRDGKDNFVKAVPVS